ncbi:MAG: GNAT family N-acetyltransferase [Clostridia bacterium]|nr:GNAT family N-acetyltransferase [Clostridia bacterium]
MATIRYAHVEDESTLQRVIDLCSGVLGEHVCQREPYRWEDWRARLTACPELLLYAADGERIVSAVLGRPESTESLVCGFVSCDAEYRRQGITRCLMGMLADKARQKGFSYITLGSEADGFYEKCGYKPIFKIHGQTIYQLIL